MYYLHCYINLIARCTMISFTCASDVLPVERRVSAPLRAACVCSWALIVSLAVAVLFNNKCDDGTKYCSFEIHPLWSRFIRCALSWDVF